MATAEAPTGVSKADLVRWSFERLSEGDIDALRKFWTPETRERFPEATVQGTDEIAEYFNEVINAVEGFQIEPLTVVEQGDDVFVQWKMTGRHTGTFQGIAPTGKELSIDGIDHFVINDEGRVVSNFVVFDRVQFGQQLGMMPPDNSRGDRAMKAAFNARTKIASKLKR